MGSIVGRGIRIEIGITEAAAIPISTLTLASPPVAGATGHGLANKSLGYLTDVGGAVQLEGQSVRLSNVSANTFALEDLDATAYAAYTGGNIIPISIWATLGRITGYNKGGGAGEKLNDTVLIDTIKQELQGLLAAESVTFNLNALTISDAAMNKLRQVARNAGYLVFRITLNDGSVRHFRGQPSLPGEDVQTNAIGTGSFSVTVKGFVCEGAA